MRSSLLFANSIRPVGEYMIPDYKSCISVDEKPKRMITY